MRRPLCLICLAFVVSVFISLQIVPLSSNSYVEEEGSRKIYSGEVYQKEYKNNGLILYLRNINQVHSTNCSTNNVNEVNKDRENGILCYVSQGKEPKLGSYVLVSGETYSFSKPRNPGGFDQEMYYRIQNIGFYMKDVQIQAESTSYSKYHEGLYELRRCMENIFEQTMSQKDASIMKAMILGNKTELDKESKELYQQSGISHILAISGLHISLIGIGLYKLLKRMRVPVVLAAFSAVLIMIMYGDMVGMSSSAYRAIFMFALKMGAEVIKRTYDMLTALAMAAVGILLEQPLYIYHAGFLLSFGAIVGIGCMLEVWKADTKEWIVNKRIQKRREWMRNQCMNSIKESLLGSLSIFCIHFPIMLKVYYEFPIYSFTLNLLIIPAMGVVMGLGLGCIFIARIGIVGAGIAQIFAYGCHVILSIFEVLCEGSMKLPGARWIVGEPDTWKIIVFYGMILSMFLVYKFLKNKKADKASIPFWSKIIWLAIAVCIITYKSYSGLAITILDVGQGDCIWIETEMGNHYLIDGGSTSESKLGEYTLAPFLKETGTAVINAVFLTHLDTDHTSGILELLESEEGIRIQKVVIAKAAIRDESYQELVRLCQKKDVILAYAKAGDKISEGNLSIEVLHPEADYITESRNAYSLVMKLEYKGFHALFSGDVEADGEAVVAEQLEKDWKCHLYKVAHHGSKNSNTMELLEQIKPQLAIISCEEGNCYGHPHAETLERLESVGSKVMITKDTGAIMMKIGYELEVQTYFNKTKEME